LFFIGDEAVMILHKYLFFTSIYLMSVQELASSIIPLCDFEIMTVS